MSPPWHLGLFTWQPKSEPCIISKQDLPSCSWLCGLSLSRFAKALWDGFEGTPLPHTHPQTHTLSPRWLHKVSTLELSETWERCSFSVVKHFPWPFLALAVIWLLLSTNTQVDKSFFLTPFASSSSNSSWPFLCSPVAHILQGLTYFSLFRHLSQVLFFLLLLVLPVFVSLFSSIMFNPLLDILNSWYVHFLSPLLL